jgi:hypothetical protein
MVLPIINPALLIERMNSLAFKALGNITQYVQRQAQAQQHGLGCCSDGILVLSDASMQRTLYLCNAPYPVPVAVTSGSLTHAVVIDD